MDVDGFWTESLRRWPALEGKLESVRDPGHSLPWRPDLKVPTTWFRYSDGPALSVMREVVAAFGGRMSWVQRRFSVGAILLGFERGHSATMGLRQPRLGRCVTVPFDTDLSEPDTVWEISRRNLWADEALPYSMRRNIQTDDALQIALQVQNYPFMRAQNTQMLVADPLPMAVVGAQELLPLIHEEPEDAPPLIERREDGYPVLVNLTDEVLFIGSGSRTYKLPVGMIPTTLMATTYTRQMLVSTGLARPLAEVQLEQPDPNDWESWDVPAAQEGVMYVVPWDVMEAFPERDDFVAAGTRSRPRGWKYIDPDEADPSVPDDYWDRWVLNSVLAHPARLQDNT